ncbi:MAG: VTT domain-containing protein [Candidatus Adlerbacteria bacterium]|nr:VTT domain-containing protein [Candidatus Adlerbacteria bacterium]
MSLDQVLLLLQHYGYYILFPLAIVEGPIITVIAGLLATTGIFNPIIAYCVVVVGDLVGDSAWYAVGRYGGGPITRFLERVFGVKQETIEKAKHKIEKNRFKTTAVFKVSQGIGFAGLIAAGIVRVSYPLFIFACLLVTLVQAAVYLALGILFGSAYERVGIYFDYVAFATVAVSVCALLVWYFRKRRQA